MHARHSDLKMVCEEEERCASFLPVGGLNMVCPQWRNMGIGEVPLIVRFAKRKTIR